MFLLTNWNLSPCESEKTRSSVTTWTMTDRTERIFTTLSKIPGVSWMVGIPRHQKKQHCWWHGEFDDFYFNCTKVCDPAISRFKTGVSNASRTKEWSLWPCPADGYMVSKWCRWVWLQWFWGWFWSDEFPVEVNGLTPISFQSTMLSKQHCKRLRYGHLVFNVSPSHLASGIQNQLVQFDQICQQIWIPSPWINLMSCPTSF